MHEKCPPRLLLKSDEGQGDVVWSGLSQAEDIPTCLL